MKSENPTKSESKNGNDSEKINSPSEDTQKNKIEYQLEKRGGRTRCVCRQLEDQEYWACKRQREEESE